MKLKGLTKLALSGVALAAVAATLGTSTYAWYVANSKAEVNNISGQSNTSTAGSLLINQLKNVSDNVTADSTKWTNKIDYDNLAFKKDTALNPVTRDGADFIPAGKKMSGTEQVDKTAEDATGWHDISNVEVAPTSAFGYFLIGVKTSDSTKRTVNMYIGIQNNTASPTAQVAYTADTGVTPTGVTAGNTFFEDFVYALKFDFHYQELTTNTVNTYLTNGTTTGGNFTKHTAYNAESFQNLAQSGSYSPLTDAKTDGNAHAYYKALSVDNVSGSSIIGGETDGGTTYSSTPFVLTKDTEYVLVVRYWLDGADQQCFDSCMGQSFKLSIKLETSTTA